MELSKEKKIELLKIMLKIRFFEEYVKDRYMQGEIPGFLHSYIGQEAIAAGFCIMLKKTDFITSTHRGHGHVIAKGADINRMMSEIYGKVNGFCKGKGGSMHIADFNIRIIGANGIVGGGIPIAAGIGLSIKLKECSDVVVCFFGDGASNQGSFHEALNLASIWKLPVIFVCENNLYAMSTPQKYHQNIKNISMRKVAYNIYGNTINGNDVLKVCQEAEKVISFARNGKGPSLVECRTYRKYGHYIGDPALYKDKHEKEVWEKMDPILNYKNYLIEMGIINYNEYKHIELNIDNEIKDAANFAKESDFPKDSDALNDVYTEGFEQECL
ncbi:MAG: thiamine pyrophosphate-dependent dehydrogenase E1 component subunit alpha [Actinobacteria bacterium]|nr:thiamine pyrophosphate-dependent dehydrogenase E1 component subunit alpha [Actinomycetota bacterium]